jgi:hypothetical protein
MAQPTNWTFAGSGILVRYSTTGPHMHFQHGTVIRDFSGTQITVNEVPALGELVSVTLSIVPDSGSTTFTLFLPRVNLSVPPVAVPVTTEGVIANHHTSIAPQTLHGQLDFYTVTSLRGTAS